MKLIATILFACLSFTSICYQIDPDKFARQFQAHLDSIGTGTEFAGMTIGIALPDGQILGFALGLSDVENNIPMNPDKRMLGGSTGKIFVSAALMQQIDKGTIKLDDKVSYYLGKYDWYSRIQNADQLVIRNLMRHSSGISRYVFQEAFQSDVKLDPDRVWKPVELLSHVFDLEPLFQAGSDFAYSDTNYIILAMILEEVTGESMYDYVQSNVLDLLGLRLTQPQVSRNIDGLAIGYNGVEDPFFPGRVVIDGVYQYNLQFEWAGGGFVTNPKDLALAAKGIYEGKVFDPDLLEVYLDGREAKGLGGKWGLGVHIKETPLGTTYGHSGFFPGYITNMTYYPASKLAIAVQVNTSDRSKMDWYRKSFRFSEIALKLLNDGH